MPGKNRTDITSTGSKTSSGSDIAAFVERAKAVARPAGAARGRLVFALDATMSRQPTWDLACSLQAEMFESVARTGGLDVQLLYFRGFGECRASRWVSDAQALAKLMTGLNCEGGRTQISKVFTHARKEQTRQKVNALVFVGDAMEEDADKLAHKAGELGMLGCPIFVFQEGHDPRVEQIFRQFAKLSKGAYARFDASAPRELADLLKAVAAYATGGRDALKLQSGAPARKLLDQLG